MEASGIQERRPAGKEMAWGKGKETGKETGKVMEEQEPSSAPLRWFQGQPYCGGREHR